MIASKSTKKEYDMASNSSYNTKILYALSDMLYNACHF
jgi:hypothetical protein